MKTEMAILSCMSKHEIKSFSEVIHPKYDDDFYKQLQNDNFRNRCMDQDSSFEVFKQEAGILLLRIAELELAITKRKKQFLKEMSKELKVCLFRSILGDNQRRALTVSIFFDYLLQNSITEEEFDSIYLFKRLLPNRYTRTISEENFFSFFFKGSDLVEEEQELSISETSESEKAMPSRSSAAEFYEDFSVEDDYYKLKKHLSEQTTDKKEVKFACDDKENYPVVCNKLFYNNKLKAMEPMFLKSKEIELDNYTSSPLKEIPLNVVSLDRNNSTRKWNKNDKSPESKGKEMYGHVNFSEKSPTKTNHESLNDRVHSTKSFITHITCFDHKKAADEDFGEIRLNKMETDSSHDKNHNEDKALTRDWRQIEGKSNNDSSRGVLIELSSNDSRIKHLKDSMVSQVGSSVHSTPRDVLNIIVEEHRRTPSFKKRERLEKLRDSRREEEAKNCEKKLVWDQKISQGDIMSHHYSRSSDRTTQNKYTKSEVTTVAGNPHAVRYNSPAPTQNDRPNRSTQYKLENRDRSIEIGAKETLKATSPYRKEATKDVRHSKSKPRVPRRKFQGEGSVVFNLLLDLLEFETRLENLKTTLSQAADFNVSTLFDHMDKNCQGFVTEKDISQFLQEIGMDCSRSSIELLVSHAADKKQRVNFCAFSKLFYPVSPLQFEVMRKKLYSYNSMEGFNPRPQTCQSLRKFFELLLSFDKVKSLYKDNFCFEDFDIFLEDLRLEGKGYFRLRDFENYSSISPFSDNVKQKVMEYLDMSYCGKVSAEDIFEFLNS